MLAILALTAHAAITFDAGSDGSYGSLVVAPNTSLEVPLPADGVIHATDVMVGANATLIFTPNVNNTPVYLLSQGEIAISGTVDVRGGDAVDVVGAAGGNGGFAGSSGGSFVNAETRPQALGHRSTLLHLTGGLGGIGTLGGQTGQCGGGGGGGAILLASDVRITLDGSVLATGGSGECGPPQSNAPGGIGGHIRFVAPLVDGQGDVDTLNGPGNGNAPGFIRIDTVAPGTSDSWTVNGITPASTVFEYNRGATMVARLPTTPAARIVSVAGQTVAQETGPVLVTIPGASARTQDVVIEVSGLAAAGTVQVLLEHHRSQGIPAGINNTLTETVNLDLSTGSQVTIPVTFEPLVSTWLDVVVRP